MPNFWKLSHGWKELSFLDMVECIDEKLVYIHRTTTGITYFDIFYIH